MVNKIKIFTFIVAALITLNATAQKGKADKHFDKFEYSLAIPYYQALAEKGGNDGVYSMIRLADCYRFTNNYMAAEKWYLRALQTGKVKNNEVMYNLAQALRSQGRYDEAKVYFEKYKAVNPSDQRAKLYINFIDEIKKEKEEEYNFTVINAVDLNSAQSDFSPAIFKNGIVISSDRFNSSNTKTYGWTGASFIKLFYSSKIAGETNKYESPSIFDKDLDLAYHDGPACFTADYNNIYFTRSFIEKKIVDSSRFYTNKLRLFTSNYNGSKWSKPEPLSLNSDAYSVGHAAVSSDGNTLYFISDMQGGIGGTDIYKATKSFSDWGAPINLGNKINSIGNEMFVTLQNDSTLLFSSDGHAGYGSLDIFMSTVDKNGNWSEPKNLGKPINGPADDFAMMYFEEGKSGLFCSNRQGGMGMDDIYYFTQKKIYQDSVLVKGLVKDLQSKYVIGGATVFVHNLNDGEVRICKTNSKGEYQFWTKPSMDYEIKADKAGYNPVSCLNLTIEPKVKEDVKADDIFLEKLVINKVYDIMDNVIYYDLDKSDIRPDAAKELNKVVRFLQSNPHITIELGSHTDSRASFDYNMKLSQRRAESAVNYIVSNGISKYRIKAKGYGESQILNGCIDGVDCTEDEHQLNRRTEIKIIGIEEEKAGEEQVGTLDNYKEGDIISIEKFDEYFFKECWKKKK